MQNAECTISLLSQEKAWRMQNAKVNAKCHAKCKIGNGNSKGGLSSNYSLFIIHYSSFFLYSERAVIANPFFQRFVRIEGAVAMLQN